MKLVRRDMQLWRVTLMGASLILFGCSRPPSATPASQTETEIARLEKHLVANPPQETPRPSDPAAGATTPVTTLVSPDFKAATVKADTALLELGRATSSEAAFDAALVEARARVVAARSTVHNDHDRNAAIVLTALLAKQKELAFLNLLIQRNPTIKPDAELTAEKEACSSELRAWLQGSTADIPELLRSPCLVSARAALAVLSR
jgi:hypothetical protein